MSYPGNPSLGQETKTRILDTFQQTLDLAGKGRSQEAALGCDFILKMDPLFSPATRLQARLQGASGPVDVSDLALAPAAPAAAAVAATPPSPPPAPPAQPAAVEPPPAAVVVEPLVSEPIEVLPEAPSAAAEAVPVLEAMSIDEGGVELPLVDEAVAAPSHESQDRIGELLGEGQARYDDGDYQAAIDAWSRIFLIDIENQEAARRIELARKLKDEQERRVDELYHEAVAHREAGRLGDARAALEKLLELNPQHLSARELVEQIGDASDAPVADFAELAEPGGFEAEAVAESAPPPPVTEPVASDEGLFDPDDFGESEAAAATPSTGGVAVARPQRSFRTIAAVGLLVVAGAGYLLYSNRDRLFPNATEEAAAPAPPAAPDPIHQATQLHLSGDTQGAIDQLSALPPEHPAHARAQQQIALWRETLEEEAGAATAESNEVVDPGIDQERRAELVEEGRAAYDRREYLRAAKAFSRAERIAPLEGAAADVFQDTKRQLLPIASQIDLFQQREWELLLPTLWRMLEAEPGNRDIRTLLADSYFNLGVMDLRRNAPSKALEKFRETAGLLPEDEDGKRLLTFSEVYSNKEIDALYRVFVKNLEFRR